MYSRKDSSVNTIDKTSIQNGSKNKEMSILCIDKKENVNTLNKNVNTEKESRKKQLQIRVSTSEKEAIEENVVRHGYNSISKFARNVLTNNKNVNTKKEHQLLIKLIKIFIDHGLTVDLDEDSIILIKKIVEEENLA